MSTTQRKRRGGAVNSRRARKRNRLTASTAGSTSQAEPPEPAESAGEEVIDLTRESPDPVVIDLTQDDPDGTAEENQQERSDHGLILQLNFQICILVSHDEDETRDNDVPPGTVSCPICMDGYSEIVQSGRLIVSTKCGHVFCSQCLRESLRNADSCPVCRETLTHGDYHPIYI